MKRKPSRRKNEDCKDEREQEIGSVQQSRCSAHTFLRCAFCTHRQTPQMSFQTGRDTRLLQALSSAPKSLFSRSIDLHVGLFHHPMVTPFDWGDVAICLSEENGSGKSLATCFYISPRRKAANDTQMDHSLDTWALEQIQ